MRKCANGGLVLREVFRMELTFYACVFPVPSSRRNVHVRFHSFFMACRPALSRPSTISSASHLLLSTLHPHTTLGMAWTTTVSIDSFRHGHFILLGHARTYFILEYAPVLGVFCLRQQLAWVRMHIFR